MYLSTFTVPRTPLPGCTHAQRCHVLFTLIHCSKEPKNRTYRNHGRRHKLIHH